MKVKLFFSFAASFLLFALMIQPATFAQETTQEEVAEEEQAETTELDLADGVFKMQTPGEWATVEPKSSMIEAEFKIPMADGDESEKDGRLTIMPAGGTIEKNIKRWKGQFSQPDGSSTGDKTKVEEIEVDGMKAHMVDITGTFAERARMTDPPTMRENYRMLAAIIETGEQMYFIKLYGGAATVDANKDLFDNFIKSFSKSDD